MKQRKIVFLFGGPGSEHDVSCATAESAMPHFADEFVLCPVFVTKDRQWVVSDTFVAPQDCWRLAQALQSKRGAPVDVALEKIEELDPEVVFIGLHGEYGEDGTIQALLEAHGLSYTGSDVEASTLAMDKPKVLQLLQDEGISVPDFLELKRELGGDDAKEFIRFHGYPVVILPSDRGSSVGVSLVYSPERLNAALAYALKQSDRVMISNYIDGREVSCGLLVTQSTTLIALPPTELIPNDSHALFDYEAKYTIGETKEVTPPEMEASVIEKIQATAKRVHHLIGADGYSRVDLIIREGDPYVLEINTLPGLTPTSILPQQAAAEGITFSRLLTYVCDAVDTSGRDYTTAISD